jgi:hypothetical protein
MQTNFPIWESRKKNTCHVGCFITSVHATGYILLQQPYRKAPKNTGQKIFFDELNPAGGYASKDHETENFSTKC